VNDGRRNTALVIGAVAAAAGVAIASYLFVWRARSGRSEQQPLRSVSEVLDDCYAKMREIQSHLQDLSNSTLQPKPAQS
jgi:hypothetical protein